MSPKGKCQQITREADEKNGGKGEGVPIRFEAVCDAGDVPNLDEGEGERQQEWGGGKGGEAIEGGQADNDKGGEDENVVGGHGIVPAHADDEGVFAIFEVTGVIGETKGQDGGEEQEREGKGCHGDETVEFPKLKEKGKRRNEVGNEDGQGQLTETGIGQADRWDGITKRPDQTGNEDREDRRAEDATPIEQDREGGGDGEGNGRPQHEGGTIREEVKELASQVFDIGLGIVIPVEEKDGEKEGKYPKLAQPEEARIDGCAKITRNANA